MSQLKKLNFEHIRPRFFFFLFLVTGLHLSTSFRGRSAILSFYYSYLVFFSYKRKHNIKFSYCTSSLFFLASYNVSFWWSRVRDSRATAMSAVTASGKINKADLLRWRSLLSFLMSLALLPSWQPTYTGHWEKGFHFFPL